MGYTVLHSVTLDSDGFRLGIAEQVNTRHSKQDETEGVYRRELKGSKTRTRLVITQTYKWFATKVVSVPNVCQQ